MREGLLVVGIVAGCRIPQRPQALRGLGRGEGVATQAVQVLPSAARAGPCPRRGSRGRRLRVRRPRHRGSGYFSTTALSTRPSAASWSSCPSRYALTSPPAERRRRATTFITCTAPHQEASLHAAPLRARGAPKINKAGLSTGFDHPDGEFYAALSRGWGGGIRVGSGSSLIALSTGTRQATSEGGEEVRPTG
jgi:hypothetical protein